MNCGFVLGFSWCGVVVGCVMWFVCVCTVMFWVCDVVFCVYCSFGKLLESVQVSVVSCGRLLRLFWVLVFLGVFSLLF